MVDREVTPFLDAQPRVEVAKDLSRILEKLEVIPTNNPGELREFFYKDDFAMHLDGIVRAIRLCGTPGFYVPHREVVHPDNPDLLRAAVHARVYPNGRRGIFLLHAVGMDHPSPRVFMPIEASGYLGRPKIVDHFRLAKDGKTTEKERHILQSTASWEGQDVSFHMSPAIALGALTDITRRLRTIIQDEELQLIASVHSNQLLAEALYQPQ